MECEVQEGARWRRGGRNLPPPLPETFLPRGSFSLPWDGTERPPTSTPVGRNAPRPELPSDGTPPSNAKQIPGFVIGRWQESDDLPPPIPMSPLCRGVQQVETIDARRLKESPEITDGARRRLGWRAAREVTLRFCLALGDIRRRRTNALRAN